MANSEITQNTIKIDKLLSRIEDGDIKVPAFQRGFVWDQEQIIELLHSIYSDYPIGSILLWNSNERLNSTRNIGGFSIPDKSPTYPVNYVLDGQQRLSTIYGAFCKNRELDRHSHHVVKTDPKIFDIWFDLITQKFVPHEDIKDAAKAFPLKSLFNINEYLLEQEKLNTDHRAIVAKLLQKFNNYEIPIVTISKREKDEVGVIFERINNTGERLTTLDLMVAWTWSDSFHLKEKIDELLDTLESKSFGDLPDKIILQCLSGIIKESTSTKTILSLSSKEVKDNFEILTSSLEKVIDFLSTELIVSRDFLPHVQQIIPLTYYFAKAKAPTADQLVCIKKWFWKTSFSRRYSSQTDDKMDADIAFFKDVIKGKFDDISKYSYSITSEILVTQKFSKSSPLVRAFLLLLAQKAPLDLVTGTKIDINVALSKYNAKEYHHVFPKAYLKKLGVSSDKINSLCNFVFLSASSNKRISEKMPSDYFINIIPKSHYLDIVQTNLIPIKKEIYEENDYTKFLTERSGLIIQAVDALLI